MDNPQGSEQPNLEEFIAQLSQDPDRESIALELGVLQSIYGDDSVRLWSATNDSKGLNSNGNNGDTIRYTVELSLPDDDVTFSVLVSIPPTYPVSSPPQLQLLSRYIGAFGVDSALFGAVLRTYISSEGIEWVADNVCVFDGLEWVKERCLEWYQTKKSEKLAGELLREDERGAVDADEGKNSKISELDHSSDAQLPPPPASIPAGVKIFEAEPITDRKSSFVGRACKISDPSEVPLILNYLMSDRRIARAAHPIINAWRCQVGNVLHQDNDDDGETAAGGRLAHLLQILEINNVLVIVTRYWGGILLGPDRFKHINQAARNALDAGGFLDGGAETPTNSKKNLGRKKH
ncbi:ribosomal protein S5 domain 2-type protein [Abortiporus biennis]|nr:ribosomal protein S5 domain 2-type protein [Abortiporus biennis]